MKIITYKIPSENHSFKLYKGELVLWIQLEDKFQSIIFDYPEDLKPNELAQEIIQDLKDANLI